MDGATRFETARAAMRRAVLRWVVAGLGAAGAAGMAGAWASDLDVPFIVTPDAVTHAMLRLAGVGASDHVIDLGSGDGRIVIEAARRHGASGLGVEIVPGLVEQSRENARRAGVQARVRFAVQDLFETDLAAATVVTMYLLPEINLQLRPRLLALAPGTRIVSHDWDLGDWAPDRTLTVDAPDKPIGREKLSRLHLWVVPPAVEGAWCGDAGRTLRLQQRHQRLAGTWTDGANAWAVAGRAEGPMLLLSGRDGVVLRLRWTGPPQAATLAGEGVEGAAPVRLARGPDCR